MKMLLRTSLALTVLAFAAPAFHAGSTDCVTSTPISSLPFQISSSGCYHLTQSLQATSGFAAITIITSNVDINLNGFNLFGNGDVPDGISAAGNTSIRVRNGSIFGFDGFAIDAGNFCTVENVRLASCGEGILLEDGAQVVGCRVTGVDSHPIEVEDHSYVGRCTVEGDGSLAVAVTLGDGSVADTTGVLGALTGIRLGDFGVAKDCFVDDFGSFGIFTGEDSIVERCRVRAGTVTDPDSTTGLYLDNRSRASNCTVFHADVGVKLEDQCSLASTTITNAGTGIEASARAVIRDCSLFSMDDLGIQLGSDARVLQTTVSQSRGDGIRCVGKRSTIEGCTVDESTDDGIVLGEECVARNNLCSANGARGILAMGPGARIEGNTLDSNACGLMVLAGGHNLSTGNRALENTSVDFDLAVGNTTGPLLSLSGFIQGSNPHANFRTPLF